jgi:hypothetical protein
VEASGGPVISNSLYQQVAPVRPESTEKISGDENFAVMLKQQSPKFREQIRERFSDYYNPANFKTEPYIKRYFPNTYKLLFGP